ncbi:MAG: hypothetical protein KBC41_02505 [Candidatus Pacebacteria bacterium]|nr:hypothetical protein [Candidatus Paceibacterota bacterium]MBP9866926.1 hypothetical protein [Candidatus Paceibacterota bacterium]
MSVKDLNNEEKLDVIYEMTIENNKMLRSLRRQHYFSSIMTILYWLMVIGAIGSAYYFVRPVVTLLSNNSGKIEETVGQFNQIRNQLPEAKLINQLLNSLTGKKEINNDVAMPDDGVIDVKSATTP